MHICGRGLISKEEVGIEFVCAIRSGSLNAKPGYGMVSVLLEN